MGTVKKKKIKDKVHLSASVDREMKLKARVKAAQENKTLSAKVEELLYDYVGA